MIKKYYLILFLLILVPIWIAGCSFQTEVVPTRTVDWGPFLTEAVQTVSAKNTSIAQQTTPESTSTPLPTNTLEASLTDSPTSPQSPTLSPTPSPTLVTPTNTPLQSTYTITPPKGAASATPLASSCDRAQLVGDVTVADNSPFVTGTTFVKTWRLKNIGTCTWTKDYRLIFVSGSSMGASQLVELPQIVAPNQTVDVSVTMKSPDQVGTYRGDWMLRNASGSRFGIGTNANQAFWVKLRVVNLTNPGLTYDFAANFCKAEWKSKVGNLPCSGMSDAAEGFVKLLDTPKLEIGPDDELALWVRPDIASTGWITGMFPEFDVKTGQRFVAWVGCLADSKGCDVTFRLDYRNQSGVINTLGSWPEVLDGKVTKINLDLSALAGQRVRFILRVDVRGGDPAKANAIWFVPGIVIPSTPTATSTPQTPTETPTSTPTPTSTETPTATTASYP